VGQDNDWFSGDAERRSVVSAQPPAQAVRVDEERERLLAVDEHDGNVLPITRLELVVARDVDLLQLERGVRANLVEDPARALAQVAALRRIQDD
jgi:hypothetical protein